MSIYYKYYSKLDILSYLFYTVYSTRKPAKSLQQFDFDILKAVRLNWEHTMFNYVIGLLFIPHS